MLGLSGVAVLTVISSAIAVAGAAGLTLAILFANFKKANKDILRGEINDLRGRLETVEKAEEDCKFRLARAEITIVTLTEAVTKAAAVAELTQLVDQHHQSIMAKLDTLSRT